MLRLSLHQKTRLAAHIQLADKSSFSAKDIIIRQKKLQLGDSATLNLTGRSMKDFGVQ
jgi:hypothetical protein